MQREEVERGYGKGRRERGGMGIGRKGKRRVGNWEKKSVPANKNLRLHLCLKVMHITAECASTYRKSTLWTLF